MLIKPLRVLIVSVIVLILLISFLTYRKMQADKFENILNAKVQPENGQNVFFIDTREATENVTLTARQACAVESAASANPHLKVFLLYASRGRLQNLTITSEVDAILSYPNVFINYFDMQELSHKSPMESFLRTGRLEKSVFKIEHTSDVLRLLVLWKYGGTYLDTDMIVKKKLDSLPSNYACVQDIWYVNGAILNFDDGEGKDLAKMFIRALIANFNGDYFATNGPALITTVLEGLCKVNVSMMAEKKVCEGFHVFPEEICYAIPYQLWELFMEEDSVNEVLERTNNSVVIHFWNNLSHGRRIGVGSKAAYVQLARKYCPKTMENVKEYF